MKISTVIPVYNSEKTLSLVCEKIITVMKKHGLAYEIILVDDKSHDHSYRVMEALSQKHPEIISIRLSKNCGQQGALLCGIRHATGDYVATMDDDLQHQPTDLIRLLVEIQQGYDVVYGVPEGMEKIGFRQMGTWMKEGIFRLLLGKPSKIRLTSLRIMNQSTIEWIKHEKRAKVYLSASILQYTKNIGNLSVPYYERAHGRSNYTLKKLANLLLYVMIYYSKIPFVKGLRRDGQQYEIATIIGGHR